MLRRLVAVPAIVVLVALATASTPLAASLMQGGARATVAGGRTPAAVPGSRPGVRAADLAQSVQARDLIVMMTLFPGRVGDNELMIMYLDADGDERSTEDVRLTLSYLDYGGQSQAWPPTESLAGRIQLRGSLFPHEGKWRMDVEIWRSGMGATQASFDVKIG